MFDPNEAIDKVMGQSAGQVPQQGQKQPRPLSPKGQEFASLMLANLTANSAAPQAVEAWEAQQAASRAAPGNAPPPQPQAAPAPTA